MQCFTVKFNAVKCSAVKYSARQCSAMQYSAKFSSALYKLAPPTASQQKLVTVVHAALNSLYTNFTVNCDKELLAMVFASSTDAF